MRALPSALASAFLLLPLAACTGADPGMGFRSTASMLPQTTAASTFSGVSLPAQAGTVLTSTERENPQSRMRRTVLRGDGTLPGENFVSVETGGKAGTLPRLLRPAPVETIRAEMRAALPGVPMRLGATMEENAAGPFGYALGHSGATACIYAWQWIDRTSQTGFLAKRNPADIRVRLCKATQTAALLQAVRGMQIGDGTYGLDDTSVTGFGGDALAATGIPAGSPPVVGASGMLAETEIAEEAPPPDQQRKVQRPIPARVVPATPEPVVTADAPSIPLPPADSRTLESGTRMREKVQTELPPIPPVTDPDDDAPLIPDPGITASTR